MYILIHSWKWTHTPKPTVVYVFICIFVLCTSEIQQAQTDHGLQTFESGIFTWSVLGSLRHFNWKRSTNCAFREKTFDNFETFLEIFIKKFKRNPKRIFEDYLEFPLKISNIFRAFSTFLTKFTSTIRTNSIDGFTTGALYHTPFCIRNVRSCLAVFIVR